MAYKECAKVRDVRRYWNPSEPRGNVWNAPETRQNLMELHGTFWKTCTSTYMYQQSRQGQYSTCQNVVESSGKQQNSMEYGGNYWNFVKYVILNSSSLSEKATNSAKQYYDKLQAPKKLTKLSI